MWDHLHFFFLEEITNQGDFFFEELNSVKFIRIIFKKIKQWYYHLNTIRTSSNSLFSQNIIKIYALLDILGLAKLM